MCADARAQGPEPSGPAPGFLDSIKGLRLGERIPDHLWDLPLQVVNHPRGRDTITLREYKEKKLLVLDFWARWCAPCVRSMDKWERLQEQYPEGLALVSMHLDYDHKALPFVRSRNWKSPAVIGDGADIVNRHFFVRTFISRVVWIVNGRLFAITGTRSDDSEAVARIMAGKKADIHSVLDATYAVEK